jgi:hypothetical protein
VATCWLLLRFNSLLLRVGRSECLRCCFCCCLWLTKFTLSGEPPPCRTQHTQRYTKTWSGQGQGNGQGGEIASPACWHSHASYSTGRRGYIQLEAPQSMLSLVTPSTTAQSLYDGIVIFDSSEPICTSLCIFHSVFPQCSKRCCNPSTLLQSAVQ